MQPRSARPAAISARPSRLRRAWAAARGALRPLAAGAVAAFALALGACADPTTAPIPAASRAPRAYLASVPGSYTQLQAGANFTCALDARGTVTCWGHNSVGQAAPPAGLTGITQVAAGFAYACALGADHTVAGCWGNTLDGVAVPPAGLSGVTQLAAGLAHGCAIVNDAGAGGTVTCWGLDYAGQASPPAGLSGVTQISARFDHTCALRGDGTVTCWGEGRGTPVPLMAPSSLSGVTQITSGRDHACALRADGTVTCWATQNFSGQLDVPAGLSGVTRIAAGANHTCAVRSDGTVDCWGDNFNGQSSPPAGLSGATAVIGGDAHTCALVEGGRATCWGDNSLGQLNVPTTARIYPTATFSAPASVVAGQPFTLALTGAQIPGYPGVTTFTYAFDCGDGAGYVASAEASRACPTTAADTRAVRGKVIDQNDPAAATAYAGSVTVSPAGPRYAFGGFRAPVDAAPAVNVVKAGSAIPVKFSLGADYGLGIFKPGYPRFTSSACGAGTQAPVESTASADTRAGLTYDAASGVYTYVWKTDKALAGQCGTLELGLTDGSTHSADFRFTR